MLKRWLLRILVPDANAAAQLLRQRGVWTQPVQVDNRVRGADLRVARAHIEMHDAQQAAYAAARRR